MSSIPRENSLTVIDRQRYIQKKFNLTDEQTGTLFESEKGLTLKDADSIIENVVSMITLPIGVATGFIVNGTEIAVPMTIIRGDLISQVERAALLCAKTSGFTTRIDDNICSGQVVFVPSSGMSARDIEEAISFMRGCKDEIVRVGNATMPSMIARNGGIVDVSFGLVENTENKFVKVEIHVNVCNAMGANCVNRACEAILKYLSDKTDLVPLMGILTNLSSRRLAHAQCRWRLSDIEEVSGFTKQELAEHIVVLNELASKDFPFSSSFHRKSIMDAVSAVALCTGNDTRALQSAVHSYAQESRNYSLTNYTIDNDYIYGEISLPVPVGIVGGSIERNPSLAVFNKLMSVDSANSLAGVIACVGLANNFTFLLKSLTHSAYYSDNNSSAADATYFRVNIGGLPLSEKAASGALEVESFRGPHLFNPMHPISSDSNLKNL